MRRSSSWADEQNQLFDEERERQINKVGRIEKIDVSYNGKPRNAVLSLNKNLSTPYDIAKRMRSFIFVHYFRVILNTGLIFELTLKLVIKVAPVVVCC